MNTCAVVGCGRPTQASICPGCTRDLVEDLRSLAYTDVGGRRGHGLADDLLGLMAAPLVTTGRYEKIMITDGGDEQPVPVNLRAAGLWHTLATTIEHWARELANVNPHLHPPRPTVAATAEWMSLFPTLLAALPGAGDMHTSVTSLVERVRAAVDRPVPRLFLGRCGAELDGRVCTRELYAQDEWTFVRCRCGAKVDVAERREKLLATLRNQYLPVVEIAKVLPGFGTHVKANTMYQWISRDRIKVRYDEEGRTLLRVGDVLMRMAS